MKRPSFLLAVAAAALPQPTTPRPSEPSAFSVVAGADTIIAERFTRTATSLSGEFADRARGGRVVYDATLASNGLVTQLATRFYQSADDSTGAAASFVI